MSLGLTRHASALTRSGFALTRLGDMMWRRFSKPIPNRLRKTLKNRIMKHLNVLLNTHALAKLLPWKAKDRYRPEKYYMRGPGPKAKAKDCEAPNGERANFLSHATDRPVR